jgi:hypothetical protein
MTSPGSSFDVLLFAPIPTRLGKAGRWFIAGSHPSRPRARLQMGELCEEFPDPRIIILLVMSAFDAGTERFHDRIVDARGLAPLIDRKTLEKLTPVARREIVAATASWHTVPARPPPPPAGARLGWWLAGGGAALAIAVFALLR